MASQGLFAPGCFSKPGAFARLKVGENSCCRNIWSLEEVVETCQFFFVKKDIGAIKWGHLMNSYSYLDIDFLLKKNAYIGEMFVL